MKRKLFKNLNLVLGSALIAVSFNMFFFNNNIASVDTLGISMLLGNICDIKPFFSVFLINLILLLLSYFLLDKEYTKRIRTASLLIPTFLMLLSPITYDLVSPNLELFVAIIIGSILLSVGYALIYISGFMSGGTDVFARIIAKYFKINRSYSLIIVDGLIIFLSIFSFGLEAFIYATMALAITHQVTNQLSLGKSEYKTFYIWTKIPKEIKEYLMTTTKEDVTILHTEGGLKKDKNQVLMCVLKTSDYYGIRTGLELLDPKVFITITDTGEVINPSLELKGLKK